MQRRGVFRQGAVVGWGGTEGVLSHVVETMAFLPGGGRAAPRGSLPHPDQLGNALECHFPVFVGIAEALEGV